ncbi:MAG: hypothetical protein NC253_09405 [Ruminococcus sp.]|nr:hypothetical protein [Ruminococcus sp.]MCM1380861.1 hypothetical protein [Muribaculaceae bacterium]MCM1480727.1 hypothetical protein [Muribaculaceae bacterium]
MNCMKKYFEFCKSLKDLKECEKISEPYSVVEKFGIIKISELCADKAFELMSALFDGTYLFYSSKVSLVNTAYEKGIIDDYNMWQRIIEFKYVASFNNKNHIADILVKYIKNYYIPAFEALKENVRKRYFAEEIRLMKNVRFYIFMR